MYSKVKNAIKRDKFGRFVYHRVIKNYGIPTHIGVPAIKMVKILFSFGEFLRRKRIATNYIQNHKPKLTVPKDKGYVFLGPNDLPNTMEIVNLCQSLFEEKLKNTEQYLKDSQKVFLIPMMTEKDMNEHPELLDFSMSDEFIGAVIDYFGTIPTFFAIDLLYSPVNNTKESSQMFHFDNSDSHYLKLFLNINDVTEESGPFTFLPADRSKVLREKLGFKDNICGRITDEQVLQFYPQEEWVKATGKPGTGLLVDNTQCLHFGSRCSSKQRLIATFEFMNYHAPFESKNMPISFHNNKYEQDPVRSVFLEKIPESGLKIFG